MSNVDFLRLAANARRRALGKPELDPLEFYGELVPKLAALKMDHKFLERDVNTGFSGGEKKRNEILQLAVLEARPAPRRPWGVTGPAKHVHEKTQHSGELDALGDETLLQAGGVVAYQSIAAQALLAARDLCKMRMAELVRPLRRLMLPCWTRSTRGWTLTRCGTSRPL